MKNKTAAREMAFAAKATPPSEGVPLSGRACIAYSAELKSTEVNLSPKTLKRSSEAEGEECGSRSEDNGSDIVDSDPLEARYARADAHYVVKNTGTNEGSAVFDGSVTNSVVGGAAATLEAAHTEQPRSSSTRKRSRRRLNAVLLSDDGTAGSPCPQHAIRQGDVSVCRDLGACRTASGYGKEEEGDDRGHMDWEVPHAFPPPYASTSFPSSTLPLEPAQSRAPSYDRNESETSSMNNNRSKGDHPNGCHLQHFPGERPCHSAVGRCFQTSWPPATPRDSQDDDAQSGNDSLRSNKMKNIVVGKENLYRTHATHILSDELGVTRSITSRTHAPLERNKHLRKADGHPLVMKASPCLPGVDQHQRPAFRLAHLHEDMRKIR